MLVAKLDAFEFRLRKAIKITSLGFLLLRISRLCHVTVVAVYFAAISSPEEKIRRVADPGILLVLLSISVCHSISIGWFA